jgi:hypothetical protein
MKQLWSNKFINIQTASNYALLHDRNNDWRQIMILWFDPRTVQPAASRYTDGAIPAHITIIYCAECKGEGEVRRCVIFRISLYVERYVCVSTCVCVYACVMTVEVTAENRNLHLLSTSYKFS